MFVCLHISNQRKRTRAYFLDILHDPWEGLWVVEVDKFGPEEISKFIIVENETIKQESP